MALAQGKTGNTSGNLLNEIDKIILLFVLNKRNY